MKLLSSWNIGGTESYRWASNTHPFGYGLNAQTIPKHLRYYLEPPSGRVFVQGDLSQAEARVVAYLSRCRDLIELFNDPSRHVHKENALVVFGHAVEKDTPEYTLAKAVVHASNYREGPYKFSVQSGLPVGVVKRLLENYHRKRPEIHKWHDWVWQEIKTKGYLVGPLGDSRTFYEAISCFSHTGKMTDSQWKDAIAWVPQTTVPHVMNLGLLAMAKARDEGMDLWFHHQGHDSFVISIPDDATCQRETAEFVAVTYSNIPLTLWGQKFNIPLELGLGYSMGDNLDWHGSPITREEWQGFIDKKLSRKDRKTQILEGTYGVHLKDWRV